MAARTVTGGVFLLAVVSVRLGWSWLEKEDLTSSRATAAGDLQQLPISEVDRRSGGGGWVSHENVETLTLESECVKLK